MGADVLKLRDVHAYYGQSHVLHGVTFSAARGKVLALLGRNGAGKTTTISTIMGLIRPRAGRITLDDQSIEMSQPERICDLGIGLVPQGRRIFRSLTVQENLVVAAKAGNGGGWSLQKIYQLFPRLGERRRNSGAKLSGGEQQMLAIGRALMGNPKILLLDEPTEGLAPIMIAEIAKTIHALKREGLSVLLVEQNLHMALDVADDITVINHGEIVHCGSAAGFANESELIARYLGVAEH